MGKTYADTYLYQKYGDYNKMLFDAIMNSDRVDANSQQFEGVLYDVKRRDIYTSFLKILTSPNTVLILPKKPLPRGFKVFVANDAKEDNQVKVFIDVTEAVRLDSGIYKSINPDRLISYMISAMTAFVYKKQETLLLNNASIIKDGGKAFVKCFSYIIDRLYKISTNQALKKKIEYAIALYYQINILSKDMSKQYDHIVATAITISNIDSKDAKLVNVIFDDAAFLNINTFIDALGKAFNLEGLNISVFIDRWMTSFGTGTVFATEFFPVFSTMMTNTYVGGYIDNQKTIQTVAGDSMTVFTKTILKIGEGVLR